MNKWSMPMYGGRAVDIERQFANARIKQAAVEAGIKMQHIHSTRSLDMLDPALTGDNNDRRTDLRIILPD